MDDLLNLFKVLSDETRLRILLLLSQQELCVCELCGIMDVSQPKISKNLSKLRDLGFVTDERREKFVFYRLKEDQLLIPALIHVITEQRPDDPILRADLEKLKNKEKYVKLCNILDLYK